MARLSTSRCQPIRASRRDDPARSLLRSRSGVHASSDVSIWSGLWGRIGANLRFDGYRAFEDESPWPSTAFTASSSSVSRHVATTDCDYDQPIFPDRAKDMTVTDPISCGSPTLPASRSWPASSTSPSFSTRGRAGWSVMRSAGRAMRGGRSPPSRPRPFGGRYSKARLAIDQGIIERVVAYILLLIPSRELRRLQAISGHSCSTGVI